ncbi:MAG: DUF4922 domain-containing protein [Clostridium sp.]|nr:DUF4922 domain-containing protein [Clostridium sp.]
MIDIQSFISRQLAAWPMAAANFDALRRVEVKPLAWGKAQFNPARIASTGAKVDAASLKKRPCFLCEANRPAEQEGIEWMAPSGHDYTILINPFPIFPRHLTIPDVNHTPQRIAGRIEDMCLLAAELPGYTVFYNGPKCGASAPDHMHFQAGNSDFLCIFDTDAPFGVVRINSSDPKLAAREFEKVYAKLPIPEGEEEPMMNVLCRFADGQFQLAVIPRKKHRPSFYGSEEGQMLISPASVDLAGVMIVPVEKDFMALDGDVAVKVYDELCYTQAEIDKLVSHE